MTRDGKNPSSQHSWDWRLVSTAALILISIAGSTMLSHGAPVMLRMKLSEFPRTFEGWHGGRDQALDPESLKVLSATDILSRSYADADGHAIGLFMAFFASQRKGGAIHSPKNCLPGAGWEPVTSGTVRLRTPNNDEPAVVNDFVIQNGAHKQVVLYWYQSQGRVIASEYTAKFCLIWDALRRNRTDGSLVRIIAPVINGDEDGARKLAISFAEASFPQIQSYLPN